MCSFFTYICNVCIEVKFEINSYSKQFYLVVTFKLSVILCLCVLSPIDIAWNFYGFVCILFTENHEIREALSSSKDLITVVQKVFTQCNFQYISYKTTFFQKYYCKVNSCSILMNFFTNKGRIKCNFSIIYNLGLKITKTFQQSVSTGTLLSD